MRIFSLAFLVTATLCIATALPSAAQSTESVGKKLIAIPVRTAGCVWALMVGTPIAITRLSVIHVHEHIADVKDAEGDSSGGVIYALPMGFGEGLASGLYYGPKNAFSNFDKPFSKESVSLGTTIGPVINP